MKKWWLVLVCMLVLCIGTAAAETSSDGNWEYYPLDDGTVEISHYYGSAEELVIPVEIDGSKVSKLGDVCFAENTTLRRVTIPDAITKVSRNPFFGCTNLTEIVVSIDHPTLATIDGVLFYKPEKRLVTYPCAFTARTYTVPEGIQIVGEDAFWSSCLTDITLPSTLTMLADMAFRKCEVLDAIVLPESVTYVGSAAFNECAALRSVNLPDGLEAIYDATFALCISLTSIDIPESVISIGDSAFSGCWGLESIELPANLGALGSGAFTSCHKLQRIVLPDTLKVLAGNPFPDCTALTDIVVSIDHPVLATIDGVLFRKSDKTLLCYPAGLKGESYTIPTGIQRIAAFAFQNNHGLTEVIFPNTVTEIGREAFSHCTKLNNVILPDSLNKVDVWAFLGCYTITDITVPASVTEIGQEAFISSYSTLTIHTWRDSYAAQWAKDNGVAYDYKDALDWLTN